MVALNRRGTHFLALLLQLYAAISWNSHQPSSQRTRTSSARRYCFGTFLRTGYAQQDNVKLTQESLNQTLWDDIRSWFQGDFDNYLQVIEDRKQGMLPREGGGHENIHCTLVPLSDSTRLASFYFDGTPTAIFRFRYYELVPRYCEESDEFFVDTLLYTLNPILESKLRQKACEPSEWKAVFDSFDSADRIRLLPKCEVRWSYKRDPELHSYVASDGTGIHAVMVHGQAIVESQVSPGQQILILDQLSLYSSLLYIHDRGFDPDTGDFIYGNRRNVPYQLCRVTAFQSNQRLVVNQSLQWTLGPSYRSVEEYRSRIDAMGGPTNPRSAS
jgi:hypothetical protein